MPRLPDRKPSTQNLILSRYADTDGDGTGTKNANGDYSGAAEIFYCQPPSGVVFRITRLIVSIEDAPNMRAEHYGTLGAALTNGVQVRKQDGDGTIIDLTDALPIKANAGWGSLCYDADIKEWGAGNELVVVRWTFAKAGQDIRLVGSRNERLEIVLNDDLRGLDGHFFLLQGFQEGTAA